MKKIPIAQPELSGKTKAYVLDCIDSNWISSHGKYITLFEEKFAEFCQTKYAIATSNGTTALHLALTALGVSVGDEVLVPTVTYIATANAVTYCGAKPVFVDVCPYTLNLDPLQIEKKISTKTKGIIPVHLYGHPASMDAINEIAANNHLFVVEDAAEAHGAEYHGKRTGGLAECGIFSFFGNKIMTTGEGGMVTTNNANLAEKLKLYRGQGMDSKRRYWFPVVGYNYRMTNIQAAIGLAQLEEIDSFLAKRASLANWYHQALAPLEKDYLILPNEEKWAKPVCWLYTVFLKSGDENKRQAVMDALSLRGIETRPVFYPMHKLPPYQENDSYPMADAWAHRSINLPTFQSLTKADVDYIASALINILSELSQ